MCDELKEELNEGTKAAVKLAEHLDTMGAANASFPVYLDGSEYVITVAVVGPTNKADTAAKPF